MAAVPIIEARGLTKVYGSEKDVAAVRALSGVDLSIATGDLVAIMGPSGCGKSTLLHMLGGLDHPSGGEVYLEGRRVDTLSEARWATLRRKQIGFVFQFFNLIGNLTVAANVELPALLAGISKADARARRDALLEDLGIGDQADKVPAELSGGQRQRVALARALINQPALLLADEPTGNLDSANAHEVLALLHRYHAQGQTIVMVTHDPHVASFADRVITMRDGRIIEDRRLMPGPEAAEQPSTQAGA